MVRVRLAGSGPSQELVLLSSFSLLPSPVPPWVLSVTWYCACRFSSSSAAFSASRELSLISSLQRKIQAGAQTWWLTRQVPVGFLGSRDNFLPDVSASCEGA